MSGVGRAYFYIHIFADVYIYIYIYMYVFFGAFRVSRLFWRSLNFWDFLVEITFSEHFGIQHEFSTLQSLVSPFFELSELGIFVFSFPLNFLWFSVL